MGSLGDESSVRRLPSGEKRRQARSTNDLAQEVMNRVETVFVRSIKEWARMLVPNWNMKSDAEIKKVFSLKSLAPIEAVVGEENRTVVPSVGISPMETCSSHSKPFHQRDGHHVVALCSKLLCQFVFI